MSLQKIFQKIVSQSVALLELLNIFKFLNINDIFYIFDLDLRKVINLFFLEYF